MKVSFKQLLIFLLVTLFVVTCVSVSYYFGVFLPKQKTTQAHIVNSDFVFQKQSECREICAPLYEDQKRTDGDGVMRPEYAYNKILNTCFYAGGYLDFEAKFLTKSITNCQTNQLVGSYVDADGKPFVECEGCVKSLEEFNDMKGELFGTL